MSERTYAMWYVGWTDHMPPFHSPETNTSWLHYDEPTPHDVYSRPRGRSSRHPTVRSESGAELGNTAATAITSGVETCVYEYFDSSLHKKERENSWKAPAAQHRTRRSSFAKPEDADEFETSMADRRPVTVCTSSRTRAALVGYHC